MMSKIADLITEYCPDGVEYKELEEIFTLKNGYTPSTSNSDYWANACIPWFRMEDIRINGNILSESIQKINVSAVKGGRLFPANSILIATSATIGDHALIMVPHLSNQRFTSLSLKAEFTEFLHMKFIFYYCFLLGEWCKKNTTTSSFASVDMSAFKKFPIPIPPLPVQEEIVKILDQFTALEAELEAELEARTRQYEHYRNQLLSFEGEEVEWKPLGEVCLKTSNIKWKENRKSSFRYIDLSAVNRGNNQIEELININSENAPSRAQQIVGTNDIIFGTTRPTLKRYAIIPKHLDGQICSTGFCLLRPNQDIILPKFLFFILKSQVFFNYIENNQEGASYPSISNTKVKSFKFPIPPLAEQERIVAILDKFDALVNDIAVGLPAEIRARRQQYEYYRGKLLTFEPLNT